MIMIQESTNRVLFKKIVSPVHSSISTETFRRKFSEEIVILERELKDDMQKRQKDEKVFTDATPQTGIKKIPTLSTEKGSNPKELGKRSSSPISLTSWYYSTTIYKISTPTVASTSTPEETWGINHMDLLYKTERELMAICEWLFFRSNEKFGPSLTLISRFELLTGFGDCTLQPRYAGREEIFSTLRDDEDTHRNRRQRT